MKVLSVGALLVVLILSSLIVPTANKAMEAQRKIPWYIVNESGQDIYVRLRAGKLENMMKFLPDEKLDREILKLIARKWIKLSEFQYVTGDIFRIPNRCYVSLALDKISNWPVALRIWKSTIMVGSDGKIVKTITLFNDKAFIPIEDINLENGLPIATSAINDVSSAAVQFKDTNDLTMHESYPILVISGFNDFTFKSKKVQQNPRVLEPFQYISVLTEKKYGTVEDLINLRVTTDTLYISPEMVTIQDQ